MKNKLYITIHSHWESKSRNCENSNVSGDIEKIIFTTRSTKIIKIKIPSLQRPLQTYYTISFLSILLNFDY